MANLYYIDDNGQAHYIPVRAGVDSVNGQTGAVEIPIASNTQAGLVKTYPEWGGFGIKINPNGYLYVSSADNNAIDAKSDLYKPLVPAAIDRSVRDGLISNSQITNEDKPAICETIGANGDSWSESEIITGDTWIDGRSIYCRMITFGKLPNAGNKTVGITVDNGIDIITSVEGVAFNDAKSLFFPIPLPSPTAPIIVYIMRSSWTGITINIETTTDRSALNCYLKIKYVK